MHCWFLSRKTSSQAALKAASRSLIFSNIFFARIAGYNNEILVATAAMRPGYEPALKQCKATPSIQRSQSDSQQLLAVVAQRQTTKLAFAHQKQPRGDKNASHGRDNQRRHYLLSVAIISLFTS